MSQNPTVPEPAPAATLQQLALRLQDFAQQRDWGQFHSPKNLASALIVEAGELLEHFQWLTEEQSRNLPADKKQAVAYEMADVLLYLVQMATALDVDLVEVANAKVGINGKKYPVEESVRCPISRRLSSAESPHEEEPRKNAN